jgi:hypothetical protein
MFGFLFVLALILIAVIVSFLDLIKDLLTDKYKPRGTILFFIMGMVLGYFLFF